MAINETIRNYRLKKHLSQEELGDYLGISGQAVSKWEQGITAPDISLLPALAECFGVTIDSLFQGTNARRYPGYGSELNELVSRYTSENGTEEDFCRATKALGEVILRGMATTEDYVNYGLLRQVRSHRDSELALCYYRKAIVEGNEERDLYWMTAHQQITNLLERLGRLEEAVLEHQKWRDAEPDCAWARVSYSDALSRVGRLEEAHKEILVALRLDPDDVNVCTMAGDLYAKLGKCEEAIEYWDKAYECDPSQISCLFSKAHMFEDLGRNSEAISQFEEILEWLEKHGYNMELERAYPAQKIKELREKQKLTKF